MRSIWRSIDTTRDAAIAGFRSSVRPSVRPSVRSNRPGVRARASSPLPAFSTLYTPPAFRAPPAWIGAYEHVDSSEEGSSHSEPLGEFLKFVSTRIRTSTSTATRPTHHATTVIGSLSSLVSRLSSLVSRLSSLALLHFWTDRQKPCRCSSQHLPPRHRPHPVVASTPRVTPNQPRVRVGVRVHACPPHGRTEDEMFVRRRRRV